VFKQEAKLERAVGVASLVRAAVGSERAVEVSLPFQLRPEI